MLQLDQVAAGLQVRPYFHRYTEDALDLCDVFDSYTPGAKIKPHEICKIIGLRGKPLGIDGSDVEAMVQAGRIAEVAQYCESDVRNRQRESSGYRTELDGDLEDILEVIGGGRGAVLPENSGEKSHCWAVVAGLMGHHASAAGGAHRADGWGARVFSSQIAPPNSRVAIVAAAPTLRIPFINRVVAHCSSGMVFLSRSTRVGQKPREGLDVAVLSAMQQELARWSQLRAEVQAARLKIRAELEAYRLRPTTPNTIQ